MDRCPVCGRKHRKYPIDCMMKVTNLYSHFTLTYDGYESVPDEKKVDFLAAKSNYFDMKKYLSVNF
jgi:hypothetical protein